MIKFRLNCITSRPATIYKYWRFWCCNANISI